MDVDNEMKKHVLMINTVPTDRNGVTSVIFNLLKYVNYSGVIIDLVVINNPDERYVKEIEKNGGKVFVVSRSLKKIVRYRKDLTKIIKNGKYDVVHVHGNSATMWLEIKTAQRAGVVVRVAHSHNSACSSRGVHMVLRPMLIHDMTFGIGCSDLAKRFCFSNKKSIVLNNGIDIERFSFKQEIRDSYRKNNSLNNDFVIGHVGDFIPVKNHVFIKKIAQELKRRDINVCFICFGKGPFFEEIRRNFDTSDVKSMIYLLGSRPDIADYYKAMDLFILPSLYEGFPMVLVEAQTAGLNCLISDKVSRTTNLIGSCKYISIDQEDSVKLWADAIEQEMRNQSHNREEAKFLVEKAGFSAKQSAQVLERIYQGEIVYEV